MLARELFLAIKLKEQSVISGLDGWFPPLFVARLNSQGILLNHLQCLALKRIDLRYYLFEIVSRQFFERFDFFITELGRISFFTLFQISKDVVGIGKFYSL